MIPCCQGMGIPYGAVYMKRHLKNAAWQCFTQRFSYSQRKMGVYSITFCLFHQLCHFFDDDMSQLVLAHLRILFHMSVLVQERCDVCRAVEAGARHGDVIRDKHIQVLSFEFRFTVFDDVLGLCGEAYEELSPLLLAESIEDIRILCKIDVQGVEVFLLDLLPSGRPSVHCLS